MASVAAVEWVLAAHLYVKRRHRDELIEPIERLVTAVAIKRDQGDFGHRLGRRLDSVGVGDAPALTNECQRRDPVGPTEDERGVEPFRGERVGRRRHVGEPPVHGFVRAEALDELEPIGSRGHREHFGAEPLRELHGNVPHPTARTQDHQLHARRELDGVEACKGCEAVDRQYARFVERQPFWDERHFFFGDGGVLGEKAPLAG